MHLPESTPDISIEINGCIVRVHGDISEALQEKTVRVLYMLNDATCFKKIFIVTGYTDLRSGIDRLAYTVRSYLGEDAIEPDTLYLFCGRRTDRIKGLVWENDGYLLLYKRLEAGKFQWPRTESEVRSITSQQFRWLIEGLTTLPKKQVKRLKKAPDYTV